MGSYLFWFCIWFFGFIFSDVISLNTLVSSPDPTTNSKTTNSNHLPILKLWIRLQNFFDQSVRLFKPEDNLASPFVFPEIMRFQTSFVKIGLENYLRTVALSLRTYRLLVYPKERTKGRIFYDFDWINLLRFESWVRLRQ